MTEPTIIENGECPLCAGEIFAESLRTLDTSLESLQKQMEESRWMLELIKDRLL